LARSTRSKLSEQYREKTGTLAKLIIYAMRGVADYWIVNLEENQFEVRQTPGPTLRNRSGTATRAWRSFIPTTLSFL
jgi:Uma2 family endonuclease